MDHGSHPKIIVFCCNHDPYGALNLAGTNRKSYPPNYEALRVNCAGAVDFSLILKALDGGAAAVLVLSCPQSACRYGKGASEGESRAKKAHRILSGIGVDARRVRFEQVKPGDYNRLLEIFNTYLREIQELSGAKLG